MPFNRNVDQSKAWESVPSTRTSLTPFNKYIPVDTTLASAGTAEDLYNISNVDKATVNFAPNPGFELGTPPTGFTPVGSAILQDGTYFKTGTYGMSINPADSADLEGAYMTLEESFGGGVDMSTTKNIVASAYFRRASSSGSTARIAIRDTAGVEKALGNTVTLSDTWQRSTAVYRLTQTGTQYRIYLEVPTQHNITFYVDDLLVEIKRSTHPEDYADGSLGVNYDWQGAVNASQSRRRHGVQVIRGWDLHFTLDTYLALDQTASSTTGIFCPAGTDWSTEFPMAFTRNLSILNVNSGETPRVYGAIWGLPESSNPEG